jgi:hypothetical protein
VAISPARLLLGPILRHVGTTTAAMWVQTSRPAEVEVLGCRASTSTVCDEHYALVDIDGLEPGSVIRIRCIWMQPGLAATGITVAREPDPYPRHRDGSSGGFRFLSARQG